jgi:hypothetical protein
VTGRRVAELAERAVDAAARGDAAAAVAAIQAISDEGGPPGVWDAVFAWCRMVADWSGLEPGPLQLVLEDAAGDTLDVDRMRRETAWAGRLVAAVVAGDDDSAFALCQAVGADPATVGRHVYALVRMVAATTRGGGEPPGGR